MCTSEKFLAKSPEEQYIVALSTELEKIKDTNLKLKNLFKAKGTPRGKTNKQVSQKGNKINTPEQNNDNKYV